MNTFQSTRLHLGEDHDDPSYSVDLDLTPEARPARSGEELVYCRNCGTPNYLTSSTTPQACPTCREDVIPRKLLLDLIKEKQAQADVLVAEIARARTELHFRKLRSGERYFWEQPTPAASRPTKRTAARRLTQSLPSLNLSSLAGQACLADLDF